MKKSLIALTVALLVLTVLPAGASAPAPGTFRTTGYTTNLMVIADDPYLVPTEYARLPSGYTKFHIQARGGPDYEYDDCSIYGPFYGETSCAKLCMQFGGEACGAHGDLEGSFAFDEWGLVDAFGDGVNDGMLAITTKKGTTDIHFGGKASSSSVGGSFSFQGGDQSGKSASMGTYAGNAGYVFQVFYTPCGGKNGPSCPAEVCTVRGEDLTLVDSRATWVLANDGQKSVRLERLLLYLPKENGPLSRVRLGEKTLATGPWPASPIALDLSGAAAQDREIRSGEDGMVTLEFKGKKIGYQPADYTFQADFSGGCSAIHVEFP